MKRYRHLLLSAFAITLVTAAAGSAFADDDGDGEMNDRAEFQMMANAKLSLTDAIRTAEQANGGKALGASFQGSTGLPVYEVDLGTPEGTTAVVLIDGQTGEVLKASPTMSQDEDGQDGDTDDGGTDNDSDGE